MLPEELIKFQNKVIREYFDKFTQKPGYIYFEWMPKKHIGDIIDFILDKTREAYELRIKK